MSRPIFPIKSQNRLAHLLGVEDSFLEEISQTAPDLYDEMLLIVPGKKPRPIRIPGPQLKFIQWRILTRLFREFSPHACSFGGVKGRSARKNAEQHCGQLFKMKLDVRQFYPSIHHRWVQHFFEVRLGCSPPVARILRRLLTYDSGLPQGTCTSPALSDQIMTTIDNILATEFTRAGVTYTRFVDDITVSGPFPLGRYEGFISRVLRRFGLKTHPNKTLEFRPGEEAVVTGYSCRTTIGIPSAYVSQVNEELQNAYSCSRAAGGAPPPYCRETYRGIIEYVGRVDSKAAKTLWNLFSNIRWSQFATLNLPKKKAVLQKPVS